jgi:hypothetical protein
MSERDYLVSKASRTAEGAAYAGGAALTGGALVQGTRAAMDVGIARGQIPHVRRLNRPIRELDDYREKVDAKVSDVRAKARQARGEQRAVNASNVRYQDPDHASQLRSDAQRKRMLADDRVSTTVAHRYEVHQAQRELARRDEALTRFASNKLRTGAIKAGIGVGLAAGGAGLIATGAAMGHKRRQR